MTVMDDEAVSAGYDGVVYSAAVADARDGCEVYEYVRVACAV